MTRVEPASKTVVAEGVMVTDASNSKVSQEVPESKSAKSLELVVNYSVDLEKQGPPGVKEPLGNYQRISAVTCILVITSVLIALSAYGLLITEQYDIQWQGIVSNEKRFPKGKKDGYFEGKTLNETALGRYIICRKDWTKDGVYFGVDRDSTFHIAQVVTMYSILLFCVLHILSACFFKRVRRNFQVISLGYGFIGLFVFSLCLTTLYFTFVHKVSAYLENALFPPTQPKDDDKCKEMLTPDNETQSLYVNMSLACAFAFSKPNRFAKKFYPHWPIERGADFHINGTVYTRIEMMELGICPRQDYLLITVFLLAVTSFFCWLGASYSEYVENKVLGPPIWLQRFKMKIHKGIRHWQTRSRIPSHLAMNKDKEKEKEKPRDEFEEVDEQSHHHHHQQHHHIHTRATVDLSRFDTNFSTFDDAYDVLDGGIDHIMLTDPFNDRGASSHKLYLSNTKLPSLE